MLPSIPTLKLEEVNRPLKHFPQTTPTNLSSLLLLRGGTVGAEPYTTVDPFLPPVTRASRCQVYPFVRFGDDARDGANIQYESIIGRIQEGRFSRWSRHLDPSVTAIVLVSWYHGIMVSWLTMTRNDA